MLVKTIPQGTDQGSGWHGHRQRLDAKIKPDSYGASTVADLTPQIAGKPAFFMSVLI